MKDTTDTKKIKISLPMLITIILLVVSVLAISIYALARYVFFTGGSTSAQVAYWHVELEDGIVQTSNVIDFPMTRTDTNTTVSTNMIAPGTFGTIPITIDSTGTEVHAKCDLTFVIQNCPTNMKFYKDARKRRRDVIEVTRTEENGVKIGTINITKYIDKADHGEHTYTLYWDWPYQTTEQNGLVESDLIDTSDMNKQVSTTVSLLGTQVLQIEEDPSEVPVTHMYAILFSDGTLELSSQPYENYSDGDTYYGDVYNWTSGHAPWHAQRNSIKSFRVKDRVQPQTVAFMFWDCTYLTNVDLDGLDIGNVTSMSYMFYNCTRLTSVDVSDLDTSNVTDMSCLFYSSGITSADLRNFDTRKVVNTEYMFCYCTSLTSVNLTGLDFSRNQNAYQMFNVCSNLVNLNLSNVNFSNVTDMRYMLASCARLSNLDLTNFRVSSVTTTSYMFDGCSSLTTLDMSSFSTSNLSTTEYMFRNCSNLTTIYVSSNFVNTNISNGYDMFRNCYNLVGGNGTAYSFYNLNQGYAVIDTAQTPGYFTEKTT